MTKQLIIRDVPDFLDSWISSECEHRNMSRQEFLMTVLKQASHPVDNEKRAEQTLLFPGRQAQLSGKVDFSFIDLFAGIGGLRLGLESAGGNCLFSSEWDRWSQKTYQAWYGEMPQGDITKILPADIPDHDVLAAGFPCQPFSIAGVSKKNALGRPHGFRDATQGTLFFNVASIIEAKRPAVVFLENVKNLLSHDRGRTWKVIKETLDGLEYEVFCKVVDASGWVPQHRERIFIVGFDKRRFGSDVPFEFPVPEGTKPKLRDILEPEVAEKYTLTDHLWQYLQDYARRHKEKGNGFGYGMADPDGITRTLSARYYKDGSEILIPQDGKNPRRLTPREAARLMGFPDRLPIVVSDTQAYRQFGNAVVPRVSAAVAERIAATLAWYRREKMGNCYFRPVEHEQEVVMEAVAGGYTGL